MVLRVEIMAKDDSVGLIVIENMFATSGENFKIEDGWYKTLDGKLIVNRDELFNFARFALSETHEQKLTERVNNGNASCLDNWYHEQMYD